jgi:hypothetical protein
LWTTVPFQKRGGALGELSARLVLGIDDRCDLMVRQVVGDGVFEMGGKVAESEVVALSKG